MRIDIRVRKVKVDAKAKNYIEEKIASLGKVLKRFDAQADVPVTVEIFPNTRHHRSGDIVAITVAVHLPGKTLVVHQAVSDVISGIDVTKDIVQREITKFKGKQLSRIRAKRK